MSAHGKGWTFGQAVLAAACIGIGIGIAAFGFIDLYLTITHLIFRWWGSWAWTVILLGEGAALGAYLAGLLADVRLARPPAALRVFLVGYLALFAAGSLTLMVSAGWGSAPDIVSHAIVPISFFGYLLLAKVLVRHLSAAPPGELDDALADARLYAMDLLRDRKGMLWRWRPGVPSLLRRQVLKGRLKASVVTAVRESLREYGDPWESAVREWVLGADGLNLSARAEADAKSVAETIRREPLPGAAETVASGALEPALGSVAEVRPSRSPAALPKLTAKRTKGMTPAELVPWATALLEADPNVSLRRAMSEMHVGDEKATEALRLARKERLQAVAR